MGHLAAVPGEYRALVRAYARTRVEFRDPASGRELVLRPGPLGHVGGDWPFPGASTAAVVTAWHPRSEPGREPARNRADLDELRSRVLGEGFRAIDCVGIGAAPDAGDGEEPGRADAEAWTEPSLLVPAVDRVRACAWAAGFEQNAIFWWTPSEWRIVGVLLAIPDVALGWRLSDAR